MRTLCGQRLGASFAFFHDVLVELRIDGQGIVTSEAGETELVHRFAGCAHHSIDIQVTKAVDPKVSADLFHWHLVRDQLFRVGKIDSVVAGEAMRRGAYPHMDFLCSCFAQGYDASAGRSPADNGVVHYHDAFSFHSFLDQVELNPDVEIANELAGLKECAPDIVISHKGMFVRQV